MHFSESSCPGDRNASGRCPHGLRTCSDQTAVQPPARSFSSPGARRAALAGVWLLALCALWGLLAPGAFAQNAVPHPPAANVAVVDLHQGVLPQLTRAASLGHLNPKQSLDIQVNLHFAQPQQAQEYAEAVSDPASPLYRQFLTPAQIAQRFGPSPQDYQAIVNYLQQSGLQITATPANRMSVSAQGTGAQMEAAFATRLNRYQEGNQDRIQRAGANGAPLTFFANATPAHLPANLAPLVESVSGLENYVRAYPKLRGLHRSSPPYAPASVRTAYDTVPIYSTGQQGQGRTLGIVSLEPTNSADTNHYITTYGLPTPAGGTGSNISFVNVNGGASGPAGFEANLDVQMVIGMAPLATVKIYNANYSAANYLAVVTRIASDNLADIVTDSWGITPSTTGSTSYTAFHNQHVLMTMQGITYLNASGDAGADLAAYGLYPETDPDVLAVGGTVMLLNASDHIQTEVGWHGSAGGYNAGVPFTRPSYQNGRGVPATPNLRLVPDIALHSAGPSDSGSYTFYFSGSLTSGIGTSFASPICCGCLALVEQALINAGALPSHRLGRINDTFYIMNGRNDIFHDIRTGTSDPGPGFPSGFSCTPYWDFVTGWGSMDFTSLYFGLAAPLAVNVTPLTAQVDPGGTVPLTATVSGSTVTSVTWAVVSGPGSVNSSGVYTAPSSVTTTQTAVVRATSTIDTASPVFGEATITVNATATVSGTITLQSCVDTAQTITFQFRPTDATAPFTLTQTLTPSGTFTGSFSLSNIPRKNYNVWIKGAKWLARVVPVDATGGNVSGVTASLLAGDANNDNSVTTSDYLLLKASFGATPSDPNWNGGVADFNCDGIVSTADYLLLKANFGQTGAP